MSTPSTFRAWVIDRSEGKNDVELKTLTPDDLPHEGDVLVRVLYSSLNYKDGLAVTGKGKILRRYPIAPGIDLAGVVEESSSPRYKPGDKVILTGWETGETYWGGYSQYVRVRSETLVPLPDGMSPKHAMSIGTAGLTAMLSVMALEKHGFDKEREVVVTGAGGGVGSLSVILLSRTGCKVVASTGRQELHDWLKECGAQEVIGREELSRDGNPLESGRWGGAVDTVGGKTLAGILRGVALHGTVAACGLAGGATFTTTVFPFILRGVKLIGIDSNYCPNDVRTEAWNRLGELLDEQTLDKLTQVRPLSEVPELSEEILAGRIRGRVVIDVQS
ncbi:MDR family oxidoreductase [Staphylospora marina]|uniref:MDR family oxidoreductase n=1 Tax=Staphylospora marina TaxID=2490858 RepID=UPI000F5BA2C0|nr:MDR family oxidoreductase [Staphylospora marina]